MTALEVGDDARPVVGVEGADCRDGVRRLVVKAELGGSGGDGDVAVENLGRIDPAGFGQCLGIAAVGVMVEEEADAVASGLRRVCGVGFLEQRHGVVPAGKHRIALAEIGEDRGVVRIQPAASLQRIEGAGGVTGEPAGEAEGVARPAGVGREFDRAGGERESPLERVRDGGVDRVAEAEGVAVDQRKAGKRLGVVGLRRHRALETHANRLDHLPVEGSPVGVKSSTAA